MEQLANAFKRITYVVAVVVCACIAPPGAYAADATPLFGLATGLGGLGDKSFNDMQYHGMVLARVAHGIQFEVATPESPADDIAVIESLIERGASVIIAGGGFHMIDPVDKLARHYPKNRFILLDDFAKEYLPNVSSVTFRQNEGAYLCGVLAGHMSKTDTVAFLGALDHPVINDFYAGYAAGAKQAVPAVRVLRRYIANDDEPREINPFNAPLRARRYALDLYGEGADVLFAVAAGSNKGVFSAALEEQKFVIGVDSDQDHMAQGFVLTSMMKRLDTAILYMVNLLLEGGLENRNYSLGLAEGGVSLTPMTYTKALIPEAVHDRLEQARRSIVRGEVTVPGTMAPRARQE